MRRFQSAPPRGDELRPRRRPGDAEEVSIRAPAWGRTRAGPDTAVLRSQVSIRAPRGDERDRLVAGRSLAPRVSIRAPAWGRTSRRSHAASVADVSIRAPAWGRTRAVRARQRAAAGVSIRAPAWGRTVTVDAHGQRRIAFQSAPPRGDERYDHDARCYRSRVSIRAPAWGRTSDRVVEQRQPGVSIRAPAWGRTAYGHCHRDWSSRVSIRAPAWGRTIAMPTGCSSPSRGFNPRPRVGTNSSPGLVWTSATARFQSAPPRGDEPRVARCQSVSIRARVGTNAAHSPCCFNPRPRVGTNAAAIAGRTPARSEVSIRAPAWGRTTAPHGHLG